MIQVKITESDSIRLSEKDFIDTINAELDWEAIEALLLEKHQFTLEEDVDYLDGDLVVHKDQIAYKLDFSIKVPLSVIVDREGNCLDMTTSSEPDPVIGEDDISEVPGVPESPDEKGWKKSEYSDMASNIAGMISDINQGDDE